MYAVGIQCGLGPFHQKASVTPQCLPDGQVTKLELCGGYSVLIIIIIAHFIA